MAEGMAPGRGKKNPIPCHSISSHPAPIIIQTSAHYAPTCTYAHAHAHAHTDTHTHTYTQCHFKTHTVASVIRPPHNNSIDHRNTVGDDIMTKDKKRWKRNGTTPSDTRDETGLALWAYLVPSKDLQFDGNYSVLSGCFCFPPRFPRYPGTHTPDCERV